MVLSLLTKTTVSVFVFTCNHNQNIRERISALYILFLQKTKIPRNWSTYKSHYNCYFNHPTDCALLCYKNILYKNSENVSLFCNTRFFESAKTWHLLDEQERWSCQNKKNSFELSITQCWHPKQGFDYGPLKLMNVVFFGNWFYSLPLAPEKQITI